MTTLTYHGRPFPELDSPVQVAAAGMVNQDITGLRRNESDYSGSEAAWAVLIAAAVQYASYTGTDLEQVILDLSEYLDSETI